MDQPMRWVCLCLDAHNFVIGPASRADEINRMTHRSHVRPPVPRQPRQQVSLSKTPPRSPRSGVSGPHGGLFAPCVAEGATFSELPEKASRFQAIDLASHDGISNLITALNFDFEWLAQHTRYSERATEWDRGGRPANRLLSGDDIAEAKAWAARRPN